MKEGKIIEQGEKEVLTEENLYQLYDTKVRQLTENDTIYFQPC